MTHQNDYNLSGKVTEEIIRNGLGALPELIKAIVDNAMREQRNRYLNTAGYERTAERQGYANDFKSKTVYTRVGKIT